MKSLPNSVARIFQAALLALAVFAFLGAGDESARFNSLGHRLMCVCGCSQILLECNHVGCTYSDRMRGELMAGLDRGENDDLTLQDFVQKYGPTVLAAPTSTGFNRVAWIMPFLALVLGLLTTIFIVLAWRKRPALAAPAGGLAGQRRGPRPLSYSGKKGHGNMTVAILACAMVTLGTLFYVFYLPGRLHMGPDKTRLAYLQERKDAVYENLRDLNFEYQAGKLPDQDYQSLKASLEEEAAGILAEMAGLEQAAASAIVRTEKEREFETLSESHFSLSCLLLWRSSSALSRRRKLLPARSRMEPPTSQRPGMKLF